MSGIDAVKKIVETETQARRIVDDASAGTQKITSEAREQGERIRQEAVGSAQGRKEEILRQAKEKAEAEARQSDQETEQILYSYRKLSDERKAAAVSKAIELILNA